MLQGSNTRFGERDDRNRLTESRQSPRNQRFGHPVKVVRSSRWNMLIQRLSTVSHASWRSEGKPIVTHQELVSHKADRKETQLSK